MSLHPKATRLALHGWKERDNAHSNVNLPFNSTSMNDPAASGGVSSFVLGRHSVLDTESRIVFWIPAFAGMTNSPRAAGNITRRDSTRKEVGAQPYVVSLLKFNVKGTNLSSHYNALKKVIEDYDLHILIVLDEVDKLLNKSGDNLLYNLLDTVRISLIMITNNVTCFDKIEDMVKSRLGGMPRILFPPYNAIQIGEILQKRVAVGFNEGVFEDTVASRIAAIAAQEHGDIRKAMEPRGQSPWYLFGIPSYARASEGYPPVAKSAEASIFQRTNDLATIYAFIHG